MEAFDKIMAIRHKMEEKGVDAFLVNTYDDHLMESPGEHWQTIRWICGFSGSAGMLIVTKRAIALWTDGRYIEQARKEAKVEGLELYDITRAGYLTTAAWLKQQSYIIDKSQFRVVFDNRTYSHKSVQDMIQECNENVDIKIYFCSDGDFLRDIWQKRPAVIHKKVFEMKTCFAGVSRKEKLALVREQMMKKDVGGYLLSSLDEIAWITNMRGREYRVHPLFKAYFLLTIECAWLFTDSALEDSQMTDDLFEDGIEFLPEKDMLLVLQKLDRSKKLYYDPRMITNYMVTCLPEHIQRVEGNDLVRWMKAQKNKGEINNLLRCNIDEGLSLCRLIRKLKAMVKTKTIYENEVGELLETERRHSKDYLMPGNIPIVGYMDNAALPHYRPVKGKAELVFPEGIVLIDVVAHYRTGTTDISRTIPLGQVNETMCCDYTAVLRALIALSCKRFPRGTDGAALDGIARNVIRSYGQDYAHGTGHGIGYCMSVHEGPQIVGQACYHRENLFCDIPIQENMVMSNEPGIYRHGEHGIRLENNIYVCKNEDKMLYFETLTLCPFDRSMIKRDMMNMQELDWLNKYHQTVYEKLSPYMNEQERIWLREETKPI